MPIPATLTSGDTASWRDGPCLLDGRRYDADGYTLTYALRGNGPAIDLTGTPDGDGWTFALTPEQASQLGAGGWWWSSTLTASGVRLAVSSGAFTVLPNLALEGGGYDGRSQAETDLAALDAAIAARINGGAVSEYSIGNRSLKRETLPTLLALRSGLLIRVRNERAARAVANGLGDPRTLAVRFGA